MREFDAVSLPEAITALFSLNNYLVEGPVQIHGAEIDLVATPKGDPFAARVYIEATIEHVDNDKYGKDMGKLAMIGAKEPTARRLIVSARGFSLPVRERARETGIDTFTYDELFSKFERFEPYVREILEDGFAAAELATLDSVYEEPQFVDQHGTDEATLWLSEWYRRTDASDRWLVTVGEYGSGKTALTKISLRRWLRAYRSNPSLPIPFRIELRDFTRQFDADGLLHHFLDHNKLGHIPIDFIWSLVRTGRVVLLLDGYDEMAQYLTARERRVCLEALAQLSAGGARGMLTSRPNYFSEAEEFHLFDVLYRDIATRSPLLARSAQNIQQREADLDQFIDTQFLNRHERALKDLTPAQTEDLVRRALHGDAEGAEVVIRILHRVFRLGDDGAALSLSGKPVIIGYLLEVVEQLKTIGGDDVQSSLTEWDVYTLVVDQLMLRDLHQAGRVSPVKRRAFLQVLAIWLSRKENAVIAETEFRELVRKEFRQELRRYDASQRQIEVENLFEDLRRSGTLARSLDPTRPGWRFSHNSLREFLLAERLVDRLSSSNPTPIDNVPITDAMRNFARSQPKDRLEVQSRLLVQNWPNRQADQAVGQTLSLLWSGLLTLTTSASPVAELITLLSASHSPALDSVNLERLTLSTVADPLRMPNLNVDSSVLTDVSVSGAELTEAKFTTCLLETVDFSDSVLTNANFSGSVIVDVNFSRAILTGADFRGIVDDSSILADTPESGLMPERLEGKAALGYLQFNGAVTDPVSSLDVLRHHPQFPIVSKVCAKFSERSPRQRLGVEQKGAAVRDIPFAKRFVAHLESAGLVEVRIGRSDVLYVTPAGRAAMSQVATGAALPEQIEEFLRNEMGPPAFPS